jgi:phosphoribosylanthranilate isomerase
MGGSGQLQTSEGCFVKICGLTNPHDAALAVEAGADAIGINLFSGSKRYVPLQEVRDWLGEFKGRALRVAVVVDPQPAEVVQIRESGCFDAIQFHGDEFPELCAASGFPTWIKAIRVKDKSSMESATSFGTPNILLDSWSGGAYGGTGVRLDWDMARDFVTDFPDKKILLAGGLTPNNLREALRIARPFGIDVASGVELNPRKKDDYLMREFVRIARETKSH